MGKFIINDLENTYMCMITKSKQFIFIVIHSNVVIQRFTWWNLSLPNSGNSFALHFQDTCLNQI